MDWRKLNRGLHRDLGYFCVGLTLLYAVSGVLLNHKHDWNAMYAINGQWVQTGPLPVGDDAKIASELAAHLKIQAPVLSTFRPDEATLNVFLDGGGMLTLDAAKGLVKVETVEKRTFTGALNDLHLNRPGKAWTVIADGYAAALALLALTGALMAVRKGAISRRGVVFTLSGLGLALVSLLFV